MFYYLYEIKNQVNNKIYVGVHKTKSMNDGYMGSGKVILSAIKKHGIENFSKTILETFANSESMFQREKEVVTDEFIARLDTYNLRRGGSGGFDYINANKLNDRTGSTHSPESRAKMGSPQSESRRKLRSEKMTGDLNVMKNPDVAKKLSESLSGKTKSDEHKRKISEAIKRRHAEKIMRV